MDELIGVGFQRRAALVLALARAAVDAAAVLPCMLHPLKLDVALLIPERLNHRILAVGPLRAIDRAPGQQRGHLGDGQPEELPGEDVVDARLPVGHLLGQPVHQPFGDLAQKDARLRARVEKGGRRVAPERRGQQIEHGVGQTRRREDLVAAQIGEAA